MQFQLLLARNNLWFQTKSLISFKIPRRQHVYDGFLVKINVLELRNLYVKISFRWYAGYVLLPFSSIKTGQKSWFQINALICKLWLTDSELLKPDYLSRRSSILPIVSFPFLWITQSPQSSVITLIKTDNYQYDEQRFTSFLFTHTHKGNKGNPNKM